MIRRLDLNHFSYWMESRYYSWCIKTTDWDSPLPKNVWQFWKMLASDLELSKEKKNWTMFQTKRIWRNYIDHFQMQVSVDMDTVFTFVCWTKTTESVVIWSWLNLTLHQSNRREFHDLNLSSLLHLWKLVHCFVISEWFWNDSKMVFGYISSEAHRFYVFVENRDIQNHYNGIL